MDIFFTQNVWRHLVCRQDLVSPLWKRDQG